MTTPPRNPPVADWATDFDHTDPRWVEDPYPIWAELREKCPVAHSDRYGGVWLPTTHEEVAAIANDDRDAVLHERHEAVGGPEIDADDFAHPSSSR